MIELILIIGLLFVLGLVALLHLTSTINNPQIRQITGEDPSPELHPWFLSVEAVLVLTIVYISQHM